MTSLVTTQWLSDHLNDENLILLDASMTKIVGIEPIEYSELALIPGSQKIDLESELCDLASSQVHALPRPEQFNAFAKKIGLNSDSCVVVYDNQGVYSAPRAWWLLKVMGIEQVWVLDGGLPTWRSEGRDIVTDYAPAPDNGSLQADFQPALVCDSQTIQQDLAAPTMTIVDARSRSRFLGTEPEPRAGLRSGHIPGALNLPFLNVLEERKLKCSDTLTVLFRQLFSGLNMEFDSLLVASCGSGITACIVLLAASEAGYKNLVLYDGSWADWGANPDLPIEL